jgi:hypothetical protein
VKKPYLLVGYRSQQCQFVGVNELPRKTEIVPILRGDARQVIAAASKFRGPVMLFDLATVKTVPLKRDKSTQPE